MNAREQFRTAALETINQALASNVNPVEIYGELQVLLLHVKVQCEMNIQQMIVLSAQARAEEAAKTAQEQPVEETKED